MGVSLIFIRLVLFQWGLRLQNAHLSHRVDNPPERVTSADALGVSIRKPSPVMCAGQCARIILAYFVRLGNSHYFLYFTLVGQLKTVLRPVAEGAAVIMICMRAVPQRILCP